MSFDNYAASNQHLADFIDRESFNNLDLIGQNQVLSTIQRYETGQCSPDFVAEIVHGSIACAKKQKGLYQMNYNQKTGHCEYTYFDWAKEGDE